MWLDEDAVRFPVEWEHPGCESLADENMGHIILLAFSSVTQTSSPVWMIMVEFKNWTSCTVCVVTKWLLSNWTCDPVEEVTRHSQTEGWDTLPLPPIYISQFINVVLTQQQETPSSPFHCLSPGSSSCISSVCLFPFNIRHSQGQSRPLLPFASQGNTTLPQGPPSRERQYANN